MGSRRTRADIKRQREQWNKDLKKFSRDFECKKILTKMINKDKWDEDQKIQMRLFKEVQE